MTTLSNEDIVELVRTAFQEMLKEREKRFDALCAQVEAKIDVGHEQGETYLSEIGFIVPPKSMAPSRIYRPPSANDRQYNPQWLQ